MSAIEERAEALVNRYRNEVNSESYWYEDPESFLGWLIALHRQPDVKESTFACYRKWLASYAEKIDEAELASRIRMVGSDAARDATAGGESLDDEGLSKRLPTPKEVAKLGRTLLSLRGKGVRYKSGYLAFSWTQYMLRTGIRPSEWRTARLFPSIPTTGGALIRRVLEVDCAQKGGYAYTEGKLITRRLVLSHWSDDEYAGLEQFLGLLPNDEAGFNRTKELVRKTLKKASSVALGDDSESVACGLYAFRHLFSDEVRRSKQVNRYGLAAMMGHSDSVNQKWYGGGDVDSGRLFTCSLAMPWRPDEIRVEMVDKARYKLVHANSSDVTPTPNISPEMD